MSKEAKVGKRVKTFREKLKMSLADLAEKSGVSVAVIASIEEGEVLPALGILTKLSRALGQRLGTFMDDQFKPDPIITRADQLSSVKVAHEGENQAGYAYYSLAIGKPDRHMDPFRIEFAENAPKMVSSHEGEELIICLEGEVELTYGAEKTILIHACWASAKVLPPVSFACSSTSLPRSALDIISSIASPSAAA